MKIQWISLAALSLRSFCRALNRFGNYGMPTGAYSSLYVDDIHDLHAACNWKYGDLKQMFPTFIMNHFETTEKYDRFEGTDYTPHNYHKYPKDSFWGRRLKAVDLSSTPIQGGICDVTRANNRSADWRFIRIGPLTSKGGYDWWQYAGHNALNMSDFTKRGTIGITGHYVAGISVENNQVLEYPPIHVHHIHLVPEKPYLRYQWPSKVESYTEFIKAMKLKAGSVDQYVPNYFVEQHGEWDPCDITDQVSGCFAESAPDGYTRLIDMELDLEGEVNDAREPHASALTWWLEIGIGWTSELADLKPLSFMVYVEDHMLISAGHQSTYENYYWVPTDRQTLSYYEGVMPTSGALVRMKHHDHMTLIRKTWLVAATKLELDLMALPRNQAGEWMHYKLTTCTSTNPWLNKKPESNNEPGKCLNTRVATTVDLDDLGFTDLDEVETFLRARMLVLPGIEPRLICELVRGLKEDVPDYGGYKFDRVGNITCRPWQFKRGDHFTSIAFHEFQADAVGPWSPGDVELLPMHNQWNIMYTDLDYPGQSNYRFSAALFREAIESVPDGAGRILLKHILETAWWNTTPHPNSGVWIKSSAMLTQMMLTSVFALTLFITAAFCALVGLICLFSMVKRKLD